MNLLDAAARAALGWVFVQAGADVVRAPEAPAKKAAPVLQALRSVSPAALPDDETVVRLNAALQVAAGAALSLGIAPRVAAAALLGSIMPTTAGGHRFWEFEPGLERVGQRNHFIKNLSIAGGLLHVAITPRKERS